MKNPYEKPVATEFSGVSPAVGNTCGTGSPEYTMFYPACNPSGAAATPACNTGGTVIPFTYCNPGASAGQSCVTGHVAG